MGIFDAYDPATYQPVQANLIDRLAAMVGAAPTNSQSPMNANAAMPAAAPAPQQASPLDIGGYSMPRVGPAAAFELPPGQLDPNTGEHVAPAPAAAAPMQPMQGQGGDLVSGYQNFMNRGADALGSIAKGGSLLGAVRGQYDDPRSTQQRDLQIQHAALVNAGFTPQEALIGALDPEARKVMITQKFGPQTVTSLGSGYVWNPRTGKAEKAYEPDDKWKVVQTGEDGLGHKTFMQQNPADGSFKPIPAAPGADTNAGLGDTSKTGAEYLATIPPQQAGIVKAMIEGRQPPPSSFALGKPYWQNMIAAAQNVDPTFDAANWSGRVAGVKDFAAGKSSEMVKSANQTLAHVNALIDSADSLHNGNYPAANWIGNKFNEATGGGEPGAFRTNAHAVAEEMSKVFKGANMSDAEIHAWEENLSPNMSPAQQRAQIAKLSELLHGSLSALEEKRLTAIGPMAAEKQGPLIKPEGQAVLKRIDAWLKSGNAAAGALPAGWSVKVN